MKYNYSHCFNNVYHFTMESILPIIRDLQLFKENDTIYVPDYKTYPKELIKRIVGDKVSVQSKMAELKDIDNTLYSRAEGIDMAKGLAVKLMLYIQPIQLKQKTILIRVRLHNRRWVPLGKNLQKLVDALYKDNFNVILLYHPHYEQTDGEGRVKVIDGKQIKDNAIYSREEMPDIKNATSLIDATYEEQCEYTKAAYAVIEATSCSGQIYALMSDTPQISISNVWCRMPHHLLGRTDENKYYAILHENKDLLDENGRYQYLDDITQIKVDNVLKAFYEVTRRRDLCGSQGVRGTI